MSKHHLRPLKKPEHEPPKAELCPDEVDLWSFWERMFEIPWKGVEGPAWACATLAIQVDQNIVNEFGLLHGKLLNSDLTSSYWEYEEEIMTARSSPNPAAIPIQAGLRCLQLAVSKSDGGGVVYNVPLQRAVAFVTYRGLLLDADADKILCEARVRDASSDTWVRDVVRGRYRRRLITGLYL